MRSPKRRRPRRRTLAKPPSNVRFEDIASKATYVGSPEHKDRPAFSIQRRPTEAGNVFNFCRALFEYLAGGENEGAVITRTASERQKRNRAFAAEFIAPVESLQKVIDGGWVDEEDIQESPPPSGRRSS